MSNVRDVRGRYIDADKFITTIDSSDELDAYSSITVCELIKNEPTADVVEVVRCKDCRHGKMKDYAPPHAPWYCTISVNYHSGKFFCACGERREK